MSKSSFMNLRLFFGFCAFVISPYVAKCQAPAMISKEDFSFLEQLTRDVLDSSRIRPGESLPDPYGKNNTGGTLVRPGGRRTYPAFWMRDYAMSLESGFVTVAEQKHMLMLTASTQCDQTWITKGGSMVPLGAIPDHIRVDDSRPIYFPGTYDFDNQGVKEFGMVPPYDDQFYFIKMAYNYLQATGDLQLFGQKINEIKLVERLELAFRVPPAMMENHIVVTNDAFRGVDFGFRDAEEITGELCYASLLKYRAARQLSEIFTKLKDPGRSQTYAKIASKLKSAIILTFANDNGMLQSSTGKSNQEDVWATAFAIYLGVMEGQEAKKAGLYLAKAYEKGTLAYKGNIRHMLTNKDFSEKTAWEISLAEKNSYQNGAYWGTPTGWVAKAIALVNPTLAARLVKEYIAELRENDFRKGPEFSSPLECFFGTTRKNGPVYLTTVSCPYITFKPLFEKK